MNTKPHLSWEEFKQFFDQSGLGTVSLIKEDNAEARINNAYHIRSVIIKDGRAHIEIEERFNDKDGDKPPRLVAIIHGSKNFTRFNMALLINDLVGKSAGLDDISGLNAQRCILAEKYSIRIDHDHLFFK